MLATIAAIIVFLSLWYTNILVSQIAEEEKSKAKSWAEAIQRKAELVNYTQELFKIISEEERKRAEIWAEANRRVVAAPIDEDPTFYTKILFSNKTIPMILTDEKGKIITHANLDPKRSKDSLYLREQLQHMKDLNGAVKIQYYENQNNYLFYDRSTIFSDLKKVLEEQIESFNEDIITNSASAPVIYTNSDQELIAFGNLDSAKVQDSTYLQGVIAEMKETNSPLEVNLGDGEKRYIYYNDSPLLVKLKCGWEWQRKLLTNWELRFPPYLLGLKC